MTKLGQLIYFEYSVQAHLFPELKKIGSSLRKMTKLGQLTHFEYTVQPCQFPELKEIEETRCLKKSK